MKFFTYRHQISRYSTSSILALTLSVICGCTGNDPSNVNVASELNPIATENRIDKIGTKTTSNLTTHTDVVDRSQRAADRPKAANVDNRATESSVLLDQWHGDLLALPNHESLDQGWNSLVTSASTGNVEAQFRLGILMLMTKPTADRAFEHDDGLDWLQEAAEQGHKLAASELGSLYYIGNLVEKNWDEAERLYELGAVHDDPKCLFGSGLIKLQRNQYGIAIPRIRKAAKLDLAVAQCQLAELYMYGTGIERDLDKATKWYLRSAKQGYALAQYNMGMLHYQNGQRKKSKQWLALAAKQDYVDAMTNLSVIYFEESNFDTAEYYINQAIALGNFEAISMRNAIQRQRDLDDRIQEGIHSKGFSGY